MKKTIFAIALLAVALVCVSHAAFNSGLEIGSKLESFSLKDPNGKLHSTEELRGKNGTLIVFLSAQCPVVKAYNERIDSLAASYKEKGINFVGIYSNTTESLEWVREHSNEHYKFTTLVDEGNVIADRFDAQFTPEVFYFNGKDILEYHGAIDNDRSGRNISIEYLKTAFEEKLAGKDIAQKETRAFGCSIKRVGD